MYFPIEFSERSSTSVFQFLQLVLSMTSHKNLGQFFPKWNYAYSFALLYNYGIQIESGFQFRFCSDYNFYIVYFLLEYFAICQFQWRIYGLPV